jgi:hypothetical protein
VPIVASISATKVFSGPLMPAVQAAIPDVVAIDRRNVNRWEGDAARGAIIATGRRKLVFSGLLTEACVSFPVLSALAAGYGVYVVGDACGGLTLIRSGVAPDGSCRSKADVMDPDPSGAPAPLDPARDLRWGTSYC